MIHALVIVAAGGLGACIGAPVGVFICPDPGDLGIGALPWFIGGGAVGAAVGVFAAAAIIGA